MKPELWHRVEEVFQRALELDERERAEFLEHSCEGDDALRHEVESLLAQETADKHFIDSPALQVVGKLFAGDAEKEAAHEGEAKLVGSTVSHYQIMEKLGGGGMGVVYRAVRVDDVYQKQVAIKLVRAGQDSGFVLSRFRNERQILASLDHPNIARLLDGGKTEEGVPYFVMELIEGEPIDEFCKRHKLALSQRLSLFSQVCSAVQYAHQRLIIHRDIKPGNILVTAEGVPKLLDFGIAKILDTEAVTGQFEPTLTVFRMMTPGYASPEQVKGEPITTASDVYSLGVVLYELLTGRHPYRTSKSTLEEVARAICETEPEKPSTAVRRARVRAEQASSQSANALEPFGDSPEKLSKKLRGDLDNIVLMALRKEPQRRYASVEQLANDMRRHLENLPVIARKDTAKYRAAKFIRRNKVAVAAAAIVVITLATGMVITLHEARIAQRRFNDVRELANSLMFDVHDSIQDLPGSTPARKLLVDRALRYLDRLSRDAQSDKSLQRELATAYEKVGTVQGNPFGANLGDIPGALQSYRKALAVREPLAKANPANIDDQVALARSQRLFAATYANRAGAPEDDTVENVGNELRALATAERAYQIAPSNPAASQELLTNYDLLVTFAHYTGDYQGALGYLQKEQPLLEAQLRAAPQDRNVQFALAKSETKTGTELANLGYRKEAIDHARHGIQMFESLSAGGTDANATRYLSFACDRFAGVLLAAGDPRDALQNYIEEVQISETSLKSDPTNAVVQADIGFALSKMGDAQGVAANSKQGLEQGLATLQRASEMLQLQIKRNPDYSEPQWSLVWNSIWTGDALARLGRSGAALDSYRAALRSWERSQNPFLQAHLAGMHVRMANVFASMGKHAEAVREARRAQEIVEPVLAKHPFMLDARYALADAYFLSGELSQIAARNSGLPPSKQLQYWNEARTWYQRSLEMWQTIHNPGVRSPVGFACGNPRRVSRQIAQCDAALARLR